MWVVGCGVHDFTSEVVVGLTSIQWNIDKEGYSRIVMQLDRLYRHVVFGMNYQNSNLRAVEQNKTNILILSIVTTRE